MKRKILTLVVSILLVLSTAFAAISATQYVDVKKTALIWQRKSES